VHERVSKRQQEDDGRQRTAAEERGSQPERLAEGIGVGRHDHRGLEERDAGKRDQSEL
jgi:hypothetical protein